jgi:putative PEP-CTERM system TPR-repeat lipoprotein
MTIQRCSNLMYTTLSRFRPHGWVWILMLLFILWPLLSMAKDSGEYLNDARSYYDKDEYNAVVIQLKNALLIEPDNAQARLLLGKAYLKLQDGLSAEKELLRAQDLDLPRELVLPPLGRAMLMNGKSEKLLQTMAIEEGDPLPLRADILVLQGRAYMTQQHYAMAEEKFTRAQDLQPENADAQVGIAQLAMQDQDIARSGELVDRAIVLDPRNEAAWILKGDLLRLAGKHSEAASAYQQALDTVPGGVRARLGKAMAYISEDKPDKALTEVGQVLDRFPNYYPAQYIKALALFQQQDLVPARDSLVSVFKQAPDHLPSHFLAGTIAYQQGQLSQAEQHLRIYWSRAPGNREATKLLAATLLKSGEPGKAIEILAPGLSSASDDAQYLALLGSAYLSHGETDRGLELLEQAAVVTPDVAGIHAQLAIGRLAQGNVDQAITRLHSAVDLGEDLIQADVLLVMAYLQSKEYDNALNAIEVLSDKMPDSPLPENLRGVTYFRMGDREAAKNAYEAALAIQPDFLPSYFNLAQLDREAGDMKKAEARYRKVLSYDEGNLKALLAMAILAAEDGRADETEKWLKQANTSHPEDFNAGLLLLKHYLQQDETQAALDLATEMQVTHPRNAAVLDLLSIAQFNAGKTKDALATIKKLAEVAPNSHEVHFQLAKVQLQQKQIDAARNSLQRAIELQHDYPEAQVALGRLDLARHGGRPEKGPSGGSLRICPRRRCAYQPT